MTFQPKGLIKYLGLSDWWLANFTGEERNKIVETFQPLGFSPASLTNTDIAFFSGTACSFLSNLAGWFRKPGERSIAYTIVGKAEALAPGAPVLDQHFLYQAKMQTYYRYRNVDQFALPRAIEACQQQIEMDKQAAAAFREQYGERLPAHVGFRQLAIIREKQGDFASAISLAQRALREGWAGDWKYGLERCQKKISKTKI